MTTLPADIAAERATIGSLLLDRDAVILVAPFLRPADFHNAHNAAIYAALLACYDQRIPPDLMTVSGELRRQQQLDTIGGFPALMDLANDAPTAVHVEHYARIVERTATQRRLIKAGGRIAQLGYDESGDLDATLATAQRELDSVATTNADGVTSLASIADATWQRLDAIQRGSLATGGVPSGFYDFDRITGGLQRSDLIVLAARPAVGKTSLALNIGTNVAKSTTDDGRPRRVAVFSLEMSKEQLFNRLLAAETHLDMRAITDGTIRDTDLPNLTDAIGRLSQLSLLIADASDCSIANIRNTCRRLAADGGLDLVIVDYIQLMDGSRKDGNRVQEVSEITRGLKKLARELDVPVLALSQLSRAVEGRTSKVPMLSDLRESGSVEQDADIVLFIYREELYDPDTDKRGLAEVHIAKHRNGATGVIPLRFDRHSTQFLNLETYRQPEGY